MDYVIKKGDNLTSIAKRFGTTVAELVSANGIQDPDFIIAGKKLTIPSKKPQKEWRQDKGLLAADPAMFDPRAQALEGSYPELVAMGVPGMVRAVATRGLLSAAPQAAANYRNIPAWLNNPATSGVMKQNPTRMMNEIGKKYLAEEPKFWIGSKANPEAIALEDLILASRF